MPCTPVAKLLNSASAAVEPLDKVLFAWHVCSLSGDGFENVATDSSLTVDLFGAVIGPVSMLMVVFPAPNPDSRDTPLRGQLGNIATTNNWLRQFAWVWNVCLT